MIPDHSLSELPVVSDLVVPTRDNQMEDYEYLPQISVNGSTRLVRAFYDYEKGAISINDSGTITNILTIANITRLGFAQDQNGRPTITYASGGETFLYWYDTVAGGMTTTPFGKDVKDGCVSLDETRFIFLGTSDIIFSYIRNGNLYFREQRTRYNTEYLLKENVYNLWQTGMGKNNRFQWATY